MARVVRPELREYSVSPTPTMQYLSRSPRLWTTISRVPPRFSGRWAYPALSGEDVVREREGAGEGGVDVLELSFGLVHVRPEPFVGLLDRFGFAPQPIITVENLTDRADAVVDHLDPLADFTQARRLGRPTHDHRVGGGLKFLVDLRPRATFSSATLGCRRSRSHSTCPESTVEDHPHILVAGETLAQVLIEIGMQSVDDKQMDRHPRDSSRPAGGEGDLRDAQEGPFLPLGLGRTSARNLPVYEPGVWAIVSGEPSATISPPSSPPSGPRSMTWSADLTTSRWCSTTSTVLPASTSRLSTPRSFLTSSRWRPVVGSSRM